MVVTLLLARHDLWPTRFGEAILTAAAVSVVTVLLLAAQRLYKARVCAVRSVELSRLARTSVVCAVAVAWLNHTQRIGPSVRVDTVAALCSFLVLVCVRTGYQSWLRTCRARGLFCRRVCILGANDEAEDLVHLFEDQPDIGYRVVAVLESADEWVNRDCGVPAFVPGPDVAAAVRSVGATGVIVAASAVDSYSLDKIVRQLVGKGLHVQISSGLTRIGHRRMRAVPLSHQVLFYVEPPSLSLWQSALKRAIDLIGASIALLFTVPILLGTALAIKVDDGGPVFYRQERVGRDDRRFQVIKFRSMVPDAGARLAELSGLNERNGPLFKLSVDPRVTRVGRILRSTSIDELPQLFNVLKGEMSLVGPRPALPAEVAQFDVDLLDRTSVRPGITGLWQVEARDNPSFLAYRRLDLFYVDNWSIVMDLTILIATLGVVVQRAIRTLTGAGELNSIPGGEPARRSEPRPVGALVASQAASGGFER
jgi:exopolysaccharide biosynthesis polyprenyl glycosylphosphotransferase